MVTTYFSSGWETGDWSEWTHKVGSGSHQPTIDSVVKYSGSYSQKNNNEDLWYSAGSDKASIAGLPAVYYIHARIRVDAFTGTNKTYTPNVLLVGESRALGSGPYGDYGIYLAIRRVAGVNQLILWDDYAYMPYNTGLTLTLGIWYDIDMKITRADNPNGRVDLYVNNTLVASATATKTDYDGVWAGCGGAMGASGTDFITMWCDRIIVDNNAELSPIGYSGGKINISGTELESDHIFDVSLEQSSNVSLRDVPLRSAGEIMDTGTYVVHTLRLEFSIRLSDSGKTTLETLFTTHAEATVYLENDDGNYWTFTGWFRDKDIVYEYKSGKPWKARLIFDIYSYSYSGGSIGTFANIQLRLVGGSILDYENIIDFSVSEETSVAIPDWINQSPEINTNVWNKKLKRVNYIVRETEYRLYQLLQMLTAASAITFYDYIHGPTNKTAWLSSIKAEWKPLKKMNVPYGSYISTPWEVEFEVIVQT